MVPATAISVAGNRRAAWRRLVARGQLTPGQIMANVRSLVLLDMDPDEEHSSSSSSSSSSDFDDKGGPGGGDGGGRSNSISSVLLGKPVGALKALKLRMMLQAEFTTEAVAALGEAVA